MSKITTRDDVGGATPANITPAVRAMIAAEVAKATENRAGQLGQDERIKKALQLQEDLTKQAEEQAKSKQALETRAAQLETRAKGLEDGLAELANRVGAPRSPDGSPVNVEPWAQWAEKQIRSSGIIEKIASGEDSGGLRSFRGRSPLGLRAFDPVTYQATIPGLIAKLVDTQFHAEPAYERPLYAMAPRVVVTAASTTYGRETEKSRLNAMHTQTTAASDELDATLTVDSTAGVHVNQVHRIYAAGGILTKTVASFVPSTGVITYTAALGADVASGVDVIAETIGPVAEGGLPPYQLISTDEVTATFRDFAVLRVLTRSATVLSDVLAEVQRRLPNRIRETAGYALLYGFTAQMDGLLSLTGRQQCLWSTGDDGDTRADAALRAWELCRGTGPKVLWCKRSDWGKVARTKSSGSEMTYMMTNFGPIQVGYSPEGGGILGPMRVMFDDNIASGDFLVIDHAASHEVQVNEALSGFEIGHMGNQFGIGEFTCRCVENFSHRILRLGTYCHGQWNSAPA